MDLEDFLSELDKIINDNSNGVKSNFESLSAEQVHFLIYDPFGNESPLKLRPLNSEDYANIPILNQIKFLVNHIREKGEVKLTKNGFFPTKLVAELYKQGYMKDEFIEEGIYKLYKETDSNTVHLSRLLLELSGITKKRKGQLSLTRAGEKTAADDQDLLELIFKTFCLKFNWPYFDGYEDENIGQLGFGFTLLLLSKYGQEFRPTDFYLEKYLDAFPQLLEGISPEYGSREEYALRMYSIRTFDRFLVYFNFISKSGGEFQKTKRGEIRTTSLFDKFVNFEQ